MSNGSRLGTVVELAKATAKEAKDDRLVGLGAEVAFFSILSLPPALLAIFGAVGAVARAIGPEATGRIRDQVLGAAGVFLTRDAVEVLRSVVDTFLREGGAGIVSVGLVLALWAASRATKVAIEAVNIAYDLEETRGPIRLRLIALGFTLLGILGAAVLLPLVVAGPQLGEWVGRPLGVGAAFATAWRTLYWPTVGLLGIGSLALFYHYAPSWKTPWRRELPGAILAVVTWLAGGAALRVYAILSLRSNAAYQGFTAPIVLLLWVYVASLAMLLGAELNAEIERRWPTVEGPPGPGAAADRSGSVAAGPWPPAQTNDGPD